VTDRAGRLRGAVAATVVAAVVTACGGGSAVAWDVVRLELPAGWEQVTAERDRLLLADHPTAEEDRGVLVTFLRSTDATPDGWRDRVAARGAELESDTGVRIAGDVPATQLVLLDVVDGVRVREVLLVVPSRGLVIAVTPRVRPGEQDGPELLLERLDAVRTVLDAMELRFRG
jgi:hypothetical protein